jgi:hypothetical protein
MHHDEKIKCVKNLNSRERIGLVLFKLNYYLFLINLFPKTIDFHAYWMLFTNCLDFAFKIHIPDSIE